MLSHMLEGQLIYVTITVKPVKIRRKCNVIYMSYLCVWTFFAFSWMILYFCLYNSLWKYTHGLTFPRRFVNFIKIYYLTFHLFYQYAHFVKKKNKNFVWNEPFCVSDVVLTLLSYSLAKIIENVCEFHYMSRSTVY